MNIVTAFIGRNKMTIWEAMDRNLMMTSSGQLFDDQGRVFDLIKGCRACIDDEHIEEALDILPKCNESGEPVE
jgi:hypothetical protein